MSCSRWHQLVALYVGGDLDSGRTVRVEQHLENCPVCRDLFEGLAADRDDLARLDARAGADLDLGSIRGAVLSEIAGRRRPFLANLRTPRLAVAAAAVAAAIVILASMVPGSGRRESLVAENVPREVVPVVEEAPEIPEEEPLVPDETTPRPPAVGSPTPVLDPPLHLAQAELPTTLSAAVSPSVPIEPMTMKILTNDPDVVIYWIVDSKGAEDA